MDKREIVEYYLNQLKGIVEAKQNCFNYYGNDYNFGRWEGYEDCLLAIDDMIDDIKTKIKD